MIICCSCVVVMMSVSFQYAAVHAHYCESSSPSCWQLQTALGSCSFLVGCLSPQHINAGTALHSGPAMPSDAAVVLATPALVSRFAACLRLAVTSQLGSSEKQATPLAWWARRRPYYAQKQCEQAKTLYSAPADPGAVGRADETVAKLPGQRSQHSMGIIVAGRMRSRVFCRFKVAPWRFLREKHFAKPCGGTYTQ